MSERGKGNRSLWKRCPIYNSWTKGGKSTISVKLSDFQRKRFTQLVTFGATSGIHIPLVLIEKGQLQYCYSGFWSMRAITVPFAVPSSPVGTESTNVGWTQKQGGGITLFLLDLLALPWGASRRKVPPHNETNFAVGELRKKEREICSILLLVLTDLTNSPLLPITL